MRLTSGSIPDIPGTTITSDSVRAMGTVRRLTAAAGDVTLGPAADAYLATLRGAEQASRPPPCSQKPPAARRRTSSVIPR